MVLPGALVVSPSRAIRGSVRVPGDKSIAHRYALLAAMAAGRSVIRGFAPGADCRSTLSCLEGLGAQFSRSGDIVTVIGRGHMGFSSPHAPLDAGNSGTTARLLAGLLAGLPFSTTLTGDESLRRRPMRRVIEPLRRMGARVESDGGRLPMTVRGGPLEAIAFVPEVPSAQVKSAVLVAGLSATGTTRVTERQPTRNHSELAMRRFGADIRVEGSAIEVTGGRHLAGAEVDVPGDFSSAAFWCVAAASLPGSSVEVERVGLNPSRTGLLAILERAGADVTALVETTSSDEPAGRVRVAHRSLQPVVVSEDEVPGVIDELPALAAMATHGGEITVRGAGELRVKESDRISALVAGLRALGADADELPDGFHVRATRPLKGGVADAVGDHRLAMAFAVAALGATGTTTILGASAVDVSYPDFFAVLGSLTA
jgi:3-phosphoshikimate 1-carboxyvinyltransferase